MSDIDTYGYSRRGIKGMWDKERRFYAYEARPLPSSITDIIPPHVEVRNKKEAPAIALATLAGGLRQNASTIAVHGVGFDVDRGMSAREVRDRGLAFGLDSLFYTTYSHCSPYTIITHNEIFKSGDPALIESFNVLMDVGLTLPKYRLPGEREHLEREAAPHVRRYLIATAKLTPEEAASLSVSCFSDVRRKQVNGKWVDDESTRTWYLRVKHLPCMSRQKSRLIYRLHKPLIVPPGESAKCARIWRRARKRIAERIGIDAVDDEATSAMCQAFYLPCHPPGSGQFAEYAHLNAGALLLDTHDYVDDADEDEYDGPSASSEPLTKAVYKAEFTRLAALAHDNSISDRAYAWEVFSVIGASWDLPRFLRGTAPSHVGSWNGEGTTLNVECPFHDFHSPDGRSPTDAGSFCQAPENTQSGVTAYWGCRHHHNERERRPTTIDMLAEALRQGWFTRTDLLNPKYISIEEDEV